MATYSQKMVKKSLYWHSHGKHQKLHPAFWRVERKRRVYEDVVWFDSVRDLFAGRRRA